MSKQPYMRTQAADLARRLPGTPALPAGSRWRTAGGQDNARQAGDGALFTYTHPQGTRTGGIRATTDRRL